MSNWLQRETEKLHFMLFLSFSNILVFFFLMWFSKCLSLWFLCLYPFVCMMNREHLNSAAPFVLLQSSTTKFLLTPFGIVKSKVFLMPNC